MDWASVASARVEVSNSLATKVISTGSPGTGGSGAGGSSLLEQELMVAAAKSAKGRSFKYLIVLPFVFLTRMLPLWQRVCLLLFHFMWISPLLADIQL